MKLSDFDYNLPKELIAQYPAEKRTDSKLLIIERKSQKIQHKKFPDIIDYINPSDVLVLNDTKVFPARLFGKKAKTLGKVEILLLERINKNSYKALIKPGPKGGQRLNIDFGKNGASAFKDGENSIIEFDSNGELQGFIEKSGQIPLPPYIKRKPEDIDRERYQTVYAEKSGAIAAPTAGLHFTDEILKSVKDKGVNVIKITLHVGYGTFKPVTCDNVKEHKMEKEYFEISKDSAARLNEARSNGGRVFCVGTTTCRALESAAIQLSTNNSQLTTYKGYTDLFIYPAYDFKFIDCLLTNFHLPRTTLLMMVSAFCGKDLLLKAYKEAIERKYRFYSYGDAMLII